MNSYYFTWSDVDVCIILGKKNRCSTSQKKICKIIFCGDEGNNKTGMWTKGRYERPYLDGKVLVGLVEEVACERRCECPEEATICPEDSVNTWRQDWPWATERRWSMLEPQGMAGRTKPAWETGSNKTSQHTAALERMWMLFYGQWEHTEKASVWCDLDSKIILAAIYHFRRGLTSPPGPDPQTP